MSNTSVLILCGGRGKRLGEKTTSVPKPMVEVNGRPMIDYIIDHFISQGFKDFTFAVGYLGHVIEEHLKTNRKDINFKISNAGESASMLKRIHHACEHFDEKVIVAYGDTYIKVDYPEVLVTHEGKEKIATLITGKIRNPFGIISTDEDGSIKTFTEKPVFTYYIGSFVFNRDLVNLMSDELIAMDDGKGLVALFDNLIQENELMSYAFDGMQVTFNTEEELTKADQQIKEFYTLGEKQ